MSDKNSNTSSENSSNQSSEMTGIVKEQRNDDFKYNTNYNKNKIETRNKSF